MTESDYELTDFIAALMVYDRVAFFNSRFAVEWVTMMLNKYGHDAFTKVSSELYKKYIRERNAFVLYEREDHAEVSRCS